MKFAHLADTHLGYKQFGELEREKDLEEVFDKIIDKIIEEKVDFVIHSGDLFDSARPTTSSLLAFQKGVLKLKGAGIPMYAIAGNHDSITRKGAIPPQVLFKKLGLKVISTINPTYVHKGIFIAGLPFLPVSKNKTLKSKLAELSKKAEDYEKSILVLHQGIDKYFSLQYELEIGDVPDNFDYYALGHIHNYICDDFGKGKLVYPGSTELLNKGELGEFNKNGKGFVVVDLDGSKPSVKRVTVELSREFITSSVSYKNLASEIDTIKHKIQDFEKKPIVFLEVQDIDTSTGDIYEFINKELGDLTLMIKLKFNTVSQEVDVNTILNDDSTLGPKELLVEELSKYNDENIDNLAVELYDLLSKDKTEESIELVSNFFNQHYNIIVGEDELNEANEHDDDVQTRL